MTFMGHHHGHDHHHDHGTKSHSKLAWAFGITASYMVVEAIGGWLTGSLALMADAGHMLSDSGALAVALVAARLATRPPDERQTMGYQRAEVLGAAINAGALLVLAVWIAVEGFERLGSPTDINAGPMMIVAAIGLVLNLAIAAILAGDHNNLNTRAALWHVLGDALGSVGALTAGALIYWKGLTWTDPVVSMCIAAIIAFGAIRVLREVFKVLMQAAPAGVDVGQLEHSIKNVEGICSIHDLHVWTLRPGEDVVSVHVVIGDADEAAAICKTVRDALLQDLPEAHVTVQAERNGACCRSSKK
jgi:cobalt-zinc-cadmium efflux system protein